MAVTVRKRVIARMANYALGAMTVFALAVPMESARAQLTLIAFGVSSMPPSMTSVRMIDTYSRSVLVWPGAARLPVVMP